MFVTYQYEREFQWTRYEKSVYIKNINNNNKIKCIHL